MSLHCEHLFGSDAGSRLFGDCGGHAHPAKGRAQDESEGWLARLSAPAPSQSVKYPACNLLRNSKIYGIPSSSSNYAQRPRRERVEKSGDEGIGREAGGRPEGRSDCDI